MRKMMTMHFGVCMETHMARIHHFKFAFCGDHREETPRKASTSRLESSASWREDFMGTASTLHAFSSILLFQAPILTENIAHSTTMPVNPYIYGFTDQWEEEWSGLSKHFQLGIFQSLHCPETGPLTQSLKTEQKVAFLFNFCHSMSSS